MTNIHEIDHFQLFRAVLLRSVLRSAKEKKIKANKALFPDVLTAVTSLSAGKAEPGNSEVFMARHLLSLIAVNCNRSQQSKAVCELCTKLH